MVGPSKLKISHFLPFNFYLMAYILYPKHLEKKSKRVEASQKYKIKKKVRKKPKFVRKSAKNLS